MKKKNPKHASKIIGWREWVSLPELKIHRIKVKVDTGATTSAIHAEDIKIFRRGQKRFVRFSVHPFQRSNKVKIQCRAELVEKRKIKSSTGHESMRPIICTNIKIGEDIWPIEVSLVNRDVMGFRMLLGRRALRSRFLVNPSRSFLIGKYKS